MSGRTGRVAVTVLLAVTLSSYCGHSAAAAHTELESATPSDGASVPAAPSMVSLIFSAEVQPHFAQIAVSSGGGRSVASGTAVVDGERVDQAVRITGAGTYTISYRIVSADGHPIQGQLSFVYAPPASTAVPGTGQPSGPGSSTSTGADRSSTDSTDSADSPDNAASSEHTDWLFLGIVGLLVLSLLTIGIRLAVRNR